MNHEASVDSGAALTSPPRLRSWHVIALGLVVCLGFAAFTGHIWEDYFITFRSSENLARGQGLVYQPGEHVHSFTSPLGTLLPALFALGDGPDVVSRALWCFRIVSAGALAAAFWLALKNFRRDSLVPAAIAVGIGAWMTDAKTIDFSTNGQECGLVVLFVVWTWHALLNGARVGPVAAGFAGLQWTRPDGCVYFAALAMAWLVFGGTPAEWRQRFVALLKGAAVGAAAYLPWVVFAWSYYGSPVPHTIIAKVARHAPAEVATALGLYPVKLLFGHVALHDSFLPAYFNFGGWPAPLHVVSRLIAVGAALPWLWPRVKVAGRVASAGFFLGGFYLEYIPGSPWYFPGWQALGWIAWAYLLHGVVETVMRRPPAAMPLLSLVRIVAALLVTTQVIVLGCTAWQMRVQQAVVENGHRREVGRWLRANSPPNATVFLEPLGYIGYFSQLKMLDFPGLASPEVVAARRGTGHPTIIHALRPDWLVLRPREVEHFNAAAPELLRDRYRLVRAFDARPAIDAHATLPGRGYLYVDAVLLVFAKVPDAGKPPP